MKYILQKLDGRFSYHRRFQYYVGFSDNMNNGLGPELYNRALKWCMDTYGWSAEVRESESIRIWYQHSVPFIKVNSTQPPSTALDRSLPDCYNPHWSWSNNMSKLRIYLAGDQELAFFQLAHPVDQK